MRLVSPWKPSLMIGDVDIDDVAGLEHTVVRDAVADDMVDRGAHGLGEAAVADVGRDRLLHVDDEFVADAGRVPRCVTPGPDVLADHVQHVGGQRARDRAISPALPGT